MKPVPLTCSITSNYADEAPFPLTTLNLPSNPYADYTVQRYARFANSSISLKAISVSPTDATEAMTVTASLSSNASDSRLLKQVIEVLTSQVAFLTRTANRPTSPGPAKSAPKQVTFERRPPGTRNEIQCYNCCEFGHFARDCPLPNTRFPKPAMNLENGKAAPPRQERQ
ncbi:Uncharacterized protein APZ42_000873 [Daphnia magna]|uniref:CCHC-type domain-containing protein n=1 Tax=Daphnia magna TaxID=35525 RepID=A0A164JBK0_9CRUS|nr:Uncharacterized protein APZ42_000873 [Daphnia magna]